MDSALACCATCLGSIPAVGTEESSYKIQMIFLPLRPKVVGSDGTRHENWRGLAFPECQDR